MRVVAYDPVLAEDPSADVQAARWPSGVEHADFIVFTSALTRDNRHMLNQAVLARCRPGVRIVNVARGPLIDEQALIAALQSRHVGGVALDVFETEPLPPDSPLRRFPQCVLGSHNGSNTIDAVRRASERAIELLFGFLGWT
jgi:D-3-phosphoglycerate dehydrogenase